jgi:hypothetical protein
MCDTCGEYLDCKSATCSRAMRSEGMRVSHRAFVCQMRLATTLGSDSSRVTRVQVDTIPAANRIETYKHKYKYIHLTSCFDM